MKAPIPHLQKRAEFLAVAASKRRFATPGLLLQVAERSIGDVEGPRIGYTASRKVGNAVVRNRARRRLRAAVALVMPGRAKPSMDYVLIARDGTAARPWEDLLKDLELAMRRLKAWSEPSPT